MYNFTEPVEQKGAEEATHRQYELEAARHSPSPPPGQSKNRFSSDSGSKAWGQASHRRLTDSEYETADRQDDDWVSCSIKPFLNTFSHLLQRIADHRLLFLLCQD